MRLYLAAGTHYEKQADVPKGTKFEAVEFPFAASPKADFVAWMNATGPAEPLFEDTTETVLNLVAQPAPIQPSPQHTAQLLAFEDQWAEFPLARKLHYAALACEDARSAIKVPG